MIKLEYTKRELEKLHEFLKDHIDQLVFDSVDQIEIEDDIVYISINFLVNHGIETFASVIYMDTAEDYDTIRFDFDRAYRVDVANGDPTYKYEEDCLYLPCSRQSTDCVDFNFAKHKIRNIFQASEKSENNETIDYLAIPFHFAKFKNGRVIF